LIERIHPYEPVYDRESRVLILGTFPSEASRAYGFYYGHKRNRFWNVLAALAGEPVPEGVDARRAFLLRNRIALGDVLRSCRIRGSSDASIRNAVPSDVGRILRESRVEAIFTNGNAAFRLYRAHLLNKTGVEARLLPSTSPANAARSLEQLIAAWSAVKPYLNKEV